MAIGRSIIAVLTGYAIFAASGGRCPLTGPAESLGSWHRRVSDILLPLWFADRVVPLCTSLYRAGGRMGPAKPRLRFDRVAQRLVQQVHDSLHAGVPEDRTVMFTVTAPIKLPAKTAESREEKITDLLARRSMPANLMEKMHGNEVCVRLAKRRSSSPASRVIGFIHNPGPHPAVLFDAAQRGRTAAKSGAERWRVIADQGGLPDIETGRAIYSQLAPATDFEEVLVVLADGSVGTLIA